LGKDGANLFALFERDDKDKTLVGIERAECAAQRMHFLGIVCAVNNEGRAAPLSLIHASRQGDVGQRVAHRGFVEAASSALEK
jgi:hypothetical protein